MKIHKFIPVLFIEIVFGSVIAGVSGQVDDDTWTHVLHLERGVQLRWNSNDDTYLTMEMSAPVKGYVSVGFSPNGAMKGSDIVLGWVDENGVPKILDMYAVGSTSPILDESQDYQLISGEERDGRTNIKFKRKWNTCDKDFDMMLGADSSRLIWAINDEDPVNNVPKYHGEHRGVRRTHVRSRAHHSKFPDETNDDPSIKYWDVRMDENEIYAEDDIYFCKIAKFPKMDKKNHLIGYRPLLQEGNEFRIHHIILYECQVPGFAGGTEDTFGQYVNQKGGRCYTPNMPPEWGEYCTTIPIVWTAGSEGNMFPSNVGNPLGEEHGGTTFFMFEVHYDNPSFRSFIDSSGFRLFYTDKLREHDSSVILVGSKLSPFHLVPPQQTSFTSKGYCTAECTAQTLPSDGVTVTTVLLHAHTSGNKITLRHIRNGKELPPIAQENHYDFNYQQVRVVEPSIKILPGDELITECEYNTTSKTKTQFGGLGTRDEMCMSFLYYYPKIGLAECKSQQEFQSFLDGLGVMNVEGEILKLMNLPYKPKEGQTVDFADNPWYLSNGTYEKPRNALDLMTISDLVSGYNTVGELIRDGIEWKDEGKSIGEKWLEGKQYAFCTGPVRKRFPLKDYIVDFPNYVPYAAPRDTQCSDSKLVPPPATTPIRPPVALPMTKTTSSNVNTYRAKTIVVSRTHHKYGNNNPTAWVPYGTIPPQPSTNTNAKAKYVYYPTVTVFDSRSQQMQRAPRMPYYASPSLHYHRPSSYYIRRYNSPPQQQYPSRRW